MRMRVHKLVSWLVFAALPCFAGEVAVLKNGFAIRHERREIVGDVTRLYVTADGSSFVDVPTAEIEHFEAAPETPAPTQSPLLAKYARNGGPGAFSGFAGYSSQRIASGVAGEDACDVDGGETRDWGLASLY